MSEKAARHPARIDQLFVGPGARADQWRDLAELAEAWSSGRASRDKLQDALAGMRATEEFHAYPGLPLLQALREHVAENHAQATASLARRITRTLLTRSFRSNPGDWDADEDGEVNTNVLPPTVRCNATVFRDPDRHRCAGDALAGPCRGVAPAAPAARRVRL